MAEAIVSRRGSMGNVAKAYTAIALTSGAAIAVADPFVSFMKSWEAESERFNALPDSLSDEEHRAIYDATLNTYNKRAATGDIPQAMTAEGAASALRKILKFGDIEGQPQDFHLLKVALNYLETAA